MLYLVKASDELVSWCQCAPSRVGAPGQLDCPWCGCGWLFSCSACRKAFTFARAEEIDADWRDLAVSDLRKARGREPDSREVDEWIAYMQRWLGDLQVGQEYVVLDGALIPRDCEGARFEGWYAKHDLEQLPHVAALTDPSVAARTLENVDYWTERRIVEDEA